MPTVRLGTWPEKGQLVTSHPGAFAVASLNLEDGARLYFVSLYGLLEGNALNAVRYAETSVHRMLSDLTPLLDEPGVQLVLAGDINLSTQLDPPYRTWSRRAFERIADFGLVEQTRRAYRDRMTEACWCEEQPTCGHERTQRHSRSTKPWHNDYMFVSKALVDRVVACEVLNQDETGWALSDHCPVVLTLDVAGKEGQ